MVVALISLVFAMTGTGLAAKTALIDGAKIKNKSISGTKLAPYSIAPKGYGLIAVKLPTGTARKAQSGFSQSNQLSTAQVAAKLLVPSSDFTNLVNTGLANTIVTGPAGAAGATGTAGLDAGTSLTARGSITGNPPGIFSKFMAVSGNPAKVGAQPIDVAMVTGAQAAKAQQVTVSVLGTWPSRASSIVVSLLINDVGVSITSLGCTVTAAQPTCTAAGPVDVPASARIAWSAQVIAQPVVPPDIPAPVEDFDLSVGFQTTAG